MWKLYYTICISLVLFPSFVFAQVFSPESRSKLGFFTSSASPTVIFSNNQKLVIDYISLFTSTVGGVSNIGCSDITSLLAVNTAGTQTGIFYAPRHIDYASTTDAYTCKGDITLSTSPTSGVTVFYNVVYHYIASSTNMTGLSTSTPSYISSDSPRYYDWLFSVSIIIFMLSFLVWGYFFSPLKPKK